MREFFGAMARHAQIDGCQIAVSDANGPVSRIELLRRVSGLAETIRPLPRVVGLLAPNDVEWVVGQLACALAGKIVVPLPNFFSPGQLEHIGRDAGVELVLATEATRPDAARMGVATHLIGDRQAPAALASVADGFGQIIYTSGSTGQPKGVRHESGQLAWSTQALAAASDAREDDRFLSVLPLCLLLETICAVFLPRSKHIGPRQASWFRNCSRYGWPSSPPRDNARHGNCDSSPPVERRFRRHSPTRPGTSAFRSMKGTACRNAVRSSRSTDPAGARRARRGRRFRALR